ncbi:MAG: GatB/YqeY domain-containing protein [Alphaproteobacteria bacterium]|nr:GatB/YqeY domain-containing protein [Alphaproteobacteria bacterium]
MAGMRETLSQTLELAQSVDDDTATNTLRLIMTAINDRDMAARARGQDKGIADYEILELLQTMVKQRREDGAYYKDHNQGLMAEHEKTEIGVIQQFLPRQFSDKEIEKAIMQVIAEKEIYGLKSMGVLMAELRRKNPAQIDFTKAAVMAKQKLGG